MNIKLIENAFIEFTKNHFIYKVPGRGKYRTEEFWDLDLNALIALIKDFKNILYS